MKIYKNKPRLLAGLFLMVCGSCILDYTPHSTIMTVIKYASMAFFFIAGLTQFSDDLLQVEFQDEQVLILHRFKDTNFIKKANVLDASVANKRIYVQTKYENYTLKKSSFDSDDFDAIVNEFLKIKAENKLTT